MVVVQLQRWLRGEEDTQTLLVALREGRRWLVSYFFRAKGPCATL